MTATLGLVVPAYQPDIERLLAYVEELSETLAPETVRVELDAASEELVAELEELPAELAPAPHRRGKGTAITAGFEALETDVLAFVDADGATPPGQLARVVEPVAERRCDLAVGSRRHPDATVATHQTLARRRLGDTFAWLARRLLTVDLYDYQCGAKAITAEAWRELRGHLYEPGFAWDVELIAVAGALGLRIEEIPIEWHDQPDSTVAPVRDSLRLARALVEARHRAKQLHDSRLHTAIARQREQPPALVDDE